MLYAILAYHPEREITSMSKAEDDALMSDLHEVHERLLTEGRLGPAARLAPTGEARTVRGPDLVLDGPFAETKEQLLGFYIVDCGSREQAVEIARDLKRVNVTAVYEVRPILLCLEGARLEGAVRLSEARAGLGRGPVNVEVPGIVGAGRGDDQD